MSKPMLPATDILQKNVRAVPTYYTRKQRDIPFHLPHRKLLGLTEHVNREAEPLTGFTLDQETRCVKEKVPDILKPDPLDEKDKKKKIQIHIREQAGQTESKDPLKQKPEIPSQQSVIDYIRQHPEKGFLYMVYAVPVVNIWFTPYYLKVVPYDETNKRNYLTISPCGVTHYTNEMVFTKLKDWETEYTIFCQLTEITFFKVYRYWKAFYVWRKSILFRKFAKMRTKLLKNLFILTPTLGKALQSIQALTCDMYMKSFADISRDMDTAFFYFYEVQLMRIEYIREKLIEYRVVVLDVITQACHTALFAEGFTYDDRFVPPFMIVRGKPVGGMTYTEKANKRKYCERLANFIKLVDYMTNYMLYRLTKRSNSLMSEMLRIHIKYTPLMELLEGKEIDQVLEVIPRPEERCKWALFQVDVYILPTGEIELIPSAELISEYMGKITNYWDEYVRSFRNYLNDETLQIFVQPHIMGKQVEWSAGEPPDLYFLMSHDKKLLSDIDLIPFAFTNAFECVWTFLKRMEGFTEFCRDALEIDLQSIIDEKDVGQYRKLCEKLTTQMELIEEVVSYQPLGIIFLSLCPFQELFRPLPRKLLDVVIQATPEIGRACIDEILTGIDEINKDISKKAETSAEELSFDKMLEDAEERVLYYENRLEYLRELYDLMGEYNCPIPPNDMNEYLGLSVLLGSLRTSVDAVIEARSKLKPSPLITGQLS